MPAYDIRRYEPRDRDAVLATFNLVFSEGDPDFEPRTVDEFRWIYEENPAGIRLYVAMTEDGVCAASYASQPNRVSVDGRQEIFCQIIDSMSHPGHRRGLKRPGLFIETARKMLDDYVSDPIVFGLPNGTAWRMGKTFLRYEMVRWQDLFVRDVGPGPAEPPADVRRIESFDERVDALYRTCSAQWGASVIRDTAYLNWRFVRNPRRDYDLFVVESGGELVGYAVFATGSWPAPGVGLLADWLVRPGEVEAGRALLEACLARARVAGTPLLVGILPEWSEWLPRYQDWGFFAHTSEYLMSGRMTQPRFDMYWLRDHWWYTLAEVDLV